MEKEIVKQARRVAETAMWVLVCVYFLLPLWVVMVLAEPIIEWQHNRRLVVLSRGLQDFGLEMARLPLDAWGRYAQRGE